MVSKVSTKTYGRKRGQDILTAFDCLSLSPPPSHDTSVEEYQQRQALGSIAANRVTKGVEAIQRVNCLPIEDGKATECVENGSELPPLKHEQVGQQVRPQAPQPRGRKAKVASHSHGRGTRGTPGQEASDPLVSIPGPSLKSLPPRLSSLLSLPYVHSVVQDFTVHYNRWEKTLSTEKIAQGSYASIFRLSLISHPELYTIWKLMPLKPKTGKGSRKAGATCIDDAVAELKLLEGLSKSPGFVEFRSAQVLIGVLPEGLRKVHEEWKRGLTEEEKDEVGDAQEYENKQLWLFVEMSDAGMDLETWLKRGLGEGTELDRSTGKRMIDAFEAWDIFWGIAEALAHGEEQAEFEHRDLHPGNICIRRRSEPSGISLNDEPRGLVRRFTDLEVTLIDYTISRATIRHDTTQQTEQVETEILVNSMHDKGLFEQNSEIERDQMQYNSYRQMRDIMHSHHKGRRKPDGWQSYMPLTNVLWLQHVLTILLQETGIFNSEWNIFEVSMEKWQRVIAVRLDALRRATDPEKIHQWKFRSAAELVSDEVNRAKERTLCEDLKGVSIVPVRKR
ncbi:MAG: hypothetical protein Q9163_000471 [Psora crenata]